MLPRLSSEDAVCCTTVQEEPPRKKALVKPRSRDHIRADLLNKLGILTPPASPNSVKPKTVVDTKNIIRLKRKLSKTRPSVHFCEAVSWIEIPSHRDYDEATKKSIWNSPREIMDAAEINQFEWFVDDCDWRNVTEECDMVQAPNGELIHPATYALWCRMEYQNCRRLRRKNREKAILDLGLRPPAAAKGMIPEQIAIA
jgi:hypothetical protein